MSQEELEAQEGIVEYSYDLGYESGYELGYSDALEEVGLQVEESYQSGHNDGFSAGAEAEQKRIQSVLQMMFDASLNMGQGNKAVQYRNAMDLLRPINFTYSEEEYRKELDDDGF